ncbi:MAG TPA: C40 family peptidase [Bacteroidales bacterium]|jgi:cell wall-associated NlpC family hydrolase|nr:C40 family peptidase [Bacteroidales bacterium]
MEKYICENVFVPLRSAPSHKSEMLSQVLFGEKYSIIDSAGHWYKIKTCFDDYSGWIDMDHLCHSPDTDGSGGNVITRSLSCFRPDGTRLVLEPGCEIYHPDFERKTFMLSGKTYTAGEEFTESIIRNDLSLSDTAMRFLNSPYIWGGRIPSGIDCSGFTQLVYKLLGKAIPRDSRQQAEKGEIISFLEEAKAGDLAFFDNERGVITHVGLILAKGLIIHSSGRVKIDIIDQQGIFRQGKYSHHLRLIKRMQS